MANNRLDDYTLRENIRACWREKLKWSSASLPVNMFFRKDGDTIVLTLNSRRLMGLPSAVANGEHVGESGTAFDAYAAALRAYMPEDSQKVCLNIVKSDTPPADPMLFTDYCNYARFLYRAMKFSEQHADWFFLSDRLQVLVDNFKEYINEHEFINIVAPLGGKTSAAEQMAKQFVNERPAVLREALGLSEGDTLAYKLPLGLRVQGAPDPTTALFAKNVWGPSMWDTHGRTMGVIEFRGGDGRNNLRRVGVLSEICLFANLAADLFGERQPDFRRNPAADDRAYLSIPSKITKVKGTIVTVPKRRHPLITKKVLQVLQKSHVETAISYAVLLFDMRGDTPVFEQEITGADEK